MTPEAIYLIAVLAAGLTASFRGWLRLDLAALLILLSLLVPWRPGAPGPDGEGGGLVPILSTEEAFSGFGSPAVIMVAAIFVLSRAMQRTGAAALLGSRLLRATSRSELWMQAGVLLFATLFSAFVSDTTTVLVWMPMILAVARERGFSGSRLLMPLAVAALLGGQWTLIGTRANVITSDFLRSQTGEGLGFFAFTPAAILVWVAACAYFLLIGRRFLPAADADESLADRYEVAEYLTEVMASASSEMVGRSLGSLELDQRSAVTVLGVVREGESLPPTPWLVVRPGDVLILQGRISKISEVVSRPGIEIREELRVGDKTLRSVDLRMVEAVLGVGSRLEGRTLAELDFHRRHELTVLAVGRRGRPLSGRPTEQKLEVGDSVLLVGHEESIQSLRGNPNLLLLETRTLPLAGKAWRAIGWMLFLIVASATGLLDPPVAVTAAAVGCLLTGCVGLRGAYQVIDWRVIVLLGSMIPYGLALEQTGTAEAMAHAVAGSLGGLGPLGLFAGILLVAVLLTQVLENSAAAVILAPVAYELALSVGAQPVPFLLGLALCCSAGFATPVAHECTLLVMGPGNYRFRHFLLVGGPLGILTWIVTVLAVPLFYPLV